MLSTMASVKILWYVDEKEVVIPKGVCYIVGSYDDELTQIRGKLVCVDPNSPNLPVVEGVTSVYCEDPLGAMFTFFKVFGPGADYELLEQQTPDVIAMIKQLATTGVPALIASPPDTPTPTVRFGYQGLQAEEYVLEGPLSTVGLAVLPVSVVCKMSGAPLIRMTNPYDLSTSFLALSTMPDCILTHAQKSYVFHSLLGGKVNPVQSTQGDVKVTFRSDWIALTQREATGVEINRRCGAVVFTIYFQQNVSNAGKSKGKASTTGDTKSSNDAKSSKNPRVTRRGAPLNC